MSHLRKTTEFADTRPDSSEGVILLNLPFISQAVPDIQTKFQGAFLGPQAPHSELLDVAFRVFNNKKTQEKQKDLTKLELQDQNWLWHLGVNANHNPLQAPDLHPSRTIIQVQQEKTLGMSIPRSEATTGALPHLQAGGSLED